MEQEKPFYVYTHSRPDGSVFYIGKGRGRRAWNFTHGRNPHHRSIIKKHGKENIIVTIYQCSCEQDAFGLEIKMIAENPELSNMTAGGEGASGRPVTEKMLMTFAENRKKPRKPESLKAQGDRLKLAWLADPRFRDNAIAMAEKRRGVPRPKHVIDALVSAHKGKKQFGEKLEKTMASLKIAQQSAKIWHGSESGRSWHEKHGKATWETREWVRCECEECGRSFGSPYPSRAKYCCANCRNKAGRRRNGKPVGIRPKRSPPQVLSGKRYIG